MNLKLHFDMRTHNLFKYKQLYTYLSCTQDYPSINIAYLKSDNAGYYHNGMLLLSLKSMGERTGICIKRYDYSDPQSKKDVCDRKIAPLKGHIYTKMDK